MPARAKNILLKVFAVTHFTTIAQTYRKMLLKWVIFTVCKVWSKLGRERKKI